MMGIPVGVRLIAAEIRATLETMVGRSPLYPCMVAAQSHDDWMVMDCQCDTVGGQRLSLH
jgi:hypothetical protein